MPAVVECERCKKKNICDFYGPPTNVEAEKSQTGEWLCKNCALNRLEEMDKAIDLFKRILNQ